jgi:hypothetical protein
MSVHSDEDGSASTAEDAVVADRYLALEIERGAVLYDRRNHRAWVQSDVAIAVSDCR